MLPRQRLAVVRFGAVAFRNDDLPRAALAKTNAGTGEVARLEAGIDQVRRTRDVLRDQLKLLISLRTAYGDSGFATGFFRYPTSGATGPVSVTLRLTPVSRPDCLFLPRQRFHEPAMDRSNAGRGR